MDLKQLKFLLQQALFILRFRYLKKWRSIIRKKWYLLHGMKVGKNTTMPKIYVTWPHQLSLGNNCNLEHNIYFKYDGIWKSDASIIIEDDVFIGAGCEFNSNCGIRIGQFSNIASGCRFIDHDHGIKAGERIGSQPSVKGNIKLHEDVWLGCNVVILKGVCIGKGAVVGAGSVVTKSIPANEIWAGVPARKIGDRK